MNAITPIAPATPLSRAGRPTRIVDLNRQFRALAVRHGAIDDSIFGFSEEHDRATASAARDEILDKILDIQDKILKLPAKCLEDAAIQTAIGYYRADQMDTWDSDTDGEKLSRAFCANHASILLAIVKAGGLDIDLIGWGDMRRLCALWAPKGMAAA